MDEMIVDGEEYTKTDISIQHVNENEWRVVYLAKDGEERKIELARINRVALAKSGLNDKWEEVVNLIITTSLAGFFQGKTRAVDVTPPKKGEKVQ